MVLISKTPNFCLILYVQIMPPPPPYTNTEHAHTDTNMLSLQGSFQSNKDCFHSIPDIML